MPVRSAGQGASSVLIRHANQRLILQRLRRLGEASRADLARAAGLTNTAVGQIIKHLEQDGLVRTLGKKHGGQRGQPATMLELDPRGAYAIGVRLDRMRIETALTDLSGTVLAHLTHDHLLPAPLRAIEIVRDDITRLAALVPAARRRRIVGVGVARPDRLNHWLEKLDLAREDFAPWEHVAFAAELERACGMPVIEENDGSAAAIAELFHGHGRSHDDFLHVFIGPAIGGGLVLGGQCVRGSTGNAGDIAVMPVGPSRLASVPRAADGREILLGRASLAGLRRHLRARGEPPAAIDAPRRSAAVDEWLDDCADALADPLLAARALLDVKLVVIDGDLSAPLLDRLIERTATRLAATAAEAAQPPALLRGSFGAMAGAVGAATLPLFLTFGPGGSAGMQRDPNRQGGAFDLVA